MRLFGVHLLVKDLSFLLMYFLIMKYNLTDETFLPNVHAGFPGASNMTLGEMLAASFVFSIAPLAISAFCYPLTYFGIKSFFGVTKVSVLLTGVVLTLTTPLIWLIGNGMASFDNKAKMVSWVLCFVISLTTYWFLNVKWNVNAKFR